jgi:hypothetical protein
MTNQNKDENRLYFIIRSWLMGQIGSVLFLTTVWFLGSINFIQTIVLGTFAFVASLAISRLFDSTIEKIVRKTINFLDKHTRAKKFILRYF